MTPAIFSTRPLPAPGALSAVEALQPVRASPGTGAGQAFSDDPFARMLEQNRQAARLQARRQQERDTATPPAPPVPPAPPGEPAPRPGAAEAPKTAPAATARVGGPAKDTPAGSAAGGNAMQSDPGKAPHLAPGSAGVRRNPAWEVRAPLTRVAARNAGQSGPEAGGVERRLGETPGADAAGVAGKSAIGNLAAQVDGQMLNPIDHPVALLKGRTARTTQTLADAAERAAGQAPTSQPDSAQQATLAGLPSALGQLAADGQAQARSQLQAAAFTLADPAATPERAASTTDATLGLPLPASAALSDALNGGINGGITGVITGVIGGVIGGMNTGTNPSASSLTGSAAQATLQAAPGSDGFGLQLGTQVTLWLKDGLQNAQLHLNPAELGPVKVAITLDGQAAQVSFSAEHLLTRQALEQAMPTLASTLAEAGFTLAGGGVFDQARQGGQPGRDEAAFGGAYGTQDGQALTGSTGTGTGTGTDTGTGTSASLPPRQRGVVDLVA